MPEKRECVTCARGDGRPQSGELHVWAFCFHSQNGTRLPSWKSREPETTRDDIIRAALEAVRDEMTKDGTWCTHSPECDDFDAPCREVAKGCAQNKVRNALALLDQEGS